MFVLVLPVLKCQHIDIAVVNSSCKRAGLQSSTDTVRRSLHPKAACCRRWSPHLTRCAIPEQSLAGCLPSETILKADRVSEMCNVKRICVFSKEKTYGLVVKEQHRTPNPSQRPEDAKAEDRPEGSEGTFESRRPGSWLRSWLGRWVGYKTWRGKKEFASAYSGPAQVAADQKRVEENKVQAFEQGP